MARSRGWCGSSRPRLRFATRCRPCVGNAAGRVRIPLRLGEESTDGGEERLRLLDVRNVAAPVNDDEACPEGARDRDRGFDGDRIVAAVRDERWDAQRREL